MTIDPSVSLGTNVFIGRYSVIEAGVTIGDNVAIGYGTIVRAGTTIGNGVSVGDLTVLGKRPTGNKKKALKPPSRLPPLVVGDGASIGSNSVIYLGVSLGEDVLVGDLASIREFVTIGESTIVGRNAVVEPHTVIGRFVTIQTSCYITSNMLIEDDVFIGPCCSTSNDKHMGSGGEAHQGPIIRRGAKIGNNATLLPGILIGERAVIGAGAVITRDVPPGVTYVGNPGRPIEDRKVTE